MIDGTDLLLSQDDFKAVYADWQAVRIVRDNYWDAWKLYFTFYTWYFATMAAIVGYILSNHPFNSKHDAFLAGAIGLVPMANFALYTIFMVFLSRKAIENVHVILARTKEAVILADKIINSRAYLMLAGSTGLGLMALIAAWSYLMFFYYVRNM